MNRQHFEQATDLLTQMEVPWGSRCSPQRQNYTIQAWGATYTSYPLLMMVIEHHQKSDPPHAHKALLGQIAGRTGGPADPGLEG